MKSDAKSKKKKSSLDFFKKPIEGNYALFMWIIVSISFLAVCISVFGGKYRELATRDFGSIRVNNLLTHKNFETKFITGYTPIFDAINSGTIGFHFLDSVNRNSSAFVSINNSLKLPYGWSVKNTMVTVLSPIPNNAPNSSIEFGHTHTSFDPVGAGTNVKITGLIPIGTANDNNLQTAGDTVLSGKGLASNSNGAGGNIIDQSICYRIHNSVITSGQLRVDIEIVKLTF